MDHLFLCFCPVLAQPGSFFIICRALVLSLDPDPWEAWDCSPTPTCPDPTLSPWALSATVAVLLPLTGSSRVPLDAGAGQFPKRSAVGAGIEVSSALSYLGMVPSVGT